MSDPNVIDLGRVRAARAALGAAVDALIATPQGRARLHHFAADLAENGAAALPPELPPMSPPTTTITIRTGPEVVAALDHLSSLLTGTAYAAGGRITRSKVADLALRRGVEFLHREINEGGDGGATTAGQSALARLEAVAERIEAAGVVVGSVAEFRKRLSPDVVAADEARGRADVGGLGEVARGLDLPPTARNVSDLAGPVGLLIGAADRIDYGAELADKAAASLAIQAKDAGIIMAGTGAARTCANDLRAVVRRVTASLVGSPEAHSTNPPEHDPAQLDIERDAAELAGAGAKPEPEPEPDPLAVALAAWMAEHGVGPTRVGALVGVHQGTVSNWKPGKRSISPKYRAKVEALIATPPPAEG